MTPKKMDEENCFFVRGTPLLNLLILIQIYNEWINDSGIFIHKQIVTEANNHQQPNLGYILVMYIEQHPNTVNLELGESEIFVWTNFTWDGAFPN